MQSSLPFIDIIVFAIIAVFLVYRLKNLLGEKTGYDPSSDDGTQIRSKTKDNVVKFSKKTNFEISDHLNGKIIALKKLDSNFSLDEFISGSNIFFKMVIESFVEGNLQDVKIYIKQNIFKSFQDALNERIKEKEQLIINIKNIKITKINDIKIFKNNVKIQVLFETIQTKALKDKNGEIIDGELDKEIIVSDLWTFERNFASDNKNWTLIETATP